MYLTQNAYYIECRDNDKFYDMDFNPAKPVKPVIYLLYGTSAPHMCVKFEINTIFYFHQLNTMLTCIIDNIAYVLLYGENCVNLFSIKGGKMEIIASFPINEVITYFSINSGRVFINKYLCDPVTEKISVVAAKYMVPEAHANIVHATYYSRNAIKLTDPKLDNEHLDIKFTITDDLTVTISDEGVSTFVGKRETFIQEVLMGNRKSLLHMNCCRHHVYREYGAEVATCETCDKTFFLSGEVANWSAHFIARSIVLYGKIEQLITRDNKSVTLIKNKNMLVQAIINVKLYFGADHVLRDNGEIITINEFYQRKVKL